MIPKKIHYCWFGRGNKPGQAVKCIQSWKKYCPDYEFIEWNEDNFDINCNRYVKQAYAAKKYAFVTDYVRLHAMYYHGGIYMDTDVEVLKPLDAFLKHQAFSGFELPEYAPTGIMASEIHFSLFKEFLDYYEERAFIDDNGQLDLTTNVSIMTNILKQYGLRGDGSMQIICDFALYPKEYFSPMDDATGQLRVTDNTHTVHWFAKSWLEPEYRLRSKATRILHRIFGKDCLAWLR